MIKLTRLLRKWHQQLSPELLNQNYGHQLPMRPVLDSIILKEMIFFPQKDIILYYQRRILNSHHHCRMRNILGWVSQKGMHDSCF